MKKIRMVLLTIISHLLFVQAVFAAIYQSVDPRGSVTFSDQPSAHTTTVKTLPPINTYTPAPSAQTPPVVVQPGNTTITSTTSTTTAPASEGNGPVANGNIEVKQAPELPTIYTTFMISSPTQGQNIWNQRQLPVNISINPVLAKGDRIQILLDGLPYQDPQNKTQFFIDNLPRGAHNISANLINAKGEIIKNSQTVNVFIHYGNVQMQQGPTLSAPIAAPPDSPVGIAPAP